jgi:hypothetical protein
MKRNKSIETSIMFHSSYQEMMARLIQPEVGVLSGQANRV